LNVLCYIKFLFLIKIIKNKFLKIFKINNENLSANKLFASYKDRLDHELKIIIEMKYASYFLIVSDYIKWAKNNDIPVGPGRGSGAGSLVAWCLSITDVDPIKFNLIFERFLNPDRISMPDFDIDFCEEKRDLVFKYLTTKYKDSVAHIITFGKLKARMVIRDVGRVLGLPYGFVDSISKMIPFDPSRPLSLTECINREPRLLKLIKEDSRVKKLNISSSEALPFIKISKAVLLSSNVKSCLLDNFFKNVFISICN